MGNRTAKGRLQWVLKCRIILYEREGCSRGGERILTAFGIKLGGGENLTGGERQGQGTRGRRMEESRSVREDIQWVLRTDERGKHGALRRENDPVL